MNFSIRMGVRFHSYIYSSSRAQKLDAFAKSILVKSYNDDAYGFMDKTKETVLNP